VHRAWSARSARAASPFTICSTSLATIARAASHPVPVGAQSFTDCVVMLEQGEVDAVSTDDAILAGLAAQDPQTHIVGPALEAEPCGRGRARPGHSVRARLRVGGSRGAIGRRG
jgi:hypothetical protein